MAKTSKKRAFSDNFESPHLKKAAQISNKVKEGSFSMASQLQSLATDFNQAATSLQSKKIEMVEYLTNFIDEVGSMTGQLSSKLGKAAKMAVESGSEQADEMIKLAKEFEKAFKDEKSRADAQSKKIKKCHFKNPVKVNVGGEVFTTTIETLGSCKGSMLEAMFSGDFLVNMSDEGHYYIEREGNKFGQILNWLRTGEIQLPEEEKQLAEIYREADYYGLQPLCDLIMPPTPTNISKIATNTNMDWLHEQLPGKKFELIYRASRDGDSPEAFHQKCDDKGPTLVIIETDEGRKFGGYTKVSWSSTQTGYRRDDTAFLFLLSGDQGEVRANKIEGSTALILHPKEHPVFYSAICWDDNSVCAFSNSSVIWSGNITKLFYGDDRDISEMIFTNFLHVKNWEVIRVT